MESLNAFCIITPGRCGSEHLVETLNSYGDLHVESEIFNRTNTDHDSFNYYLRKGVLTKTFGYFFNREKFSQIPFNFPLNSLLKKFLQSKQSECCYGFKLSLDQLFAYPYLFRVLPKLQVIYLGREDKVNQAISLTKARDTGNYHSRKGEPQKTTSVILEPEKVFNTYMEVLSMEYEFLKKLSHQKILFLTYEMLFDKYFESILRVRKTLDLSLEPPPQPSSIEKSNPKDHVQNYEDIVAELSKNGLV